MADEVVVIEAPEGETVEEAPASDASEAVTDHTIDQEGRLAALEERCNSFVTRDDLAVVASSINQVGDAVSDVGAEVAEIKVEQEQAELEEIAEEIQEAQPEPEPEPEPDNDEPPSSKKPHAWWRSRGE